MITYNECIKNDEDLRTFIFHFFANGFPNVVAIDTETTGLNSKHDRMLGISLAWKYPGQPMEGVYLPVGHQRDLFENNLSVAEVVSLLHLIQSTSWVVYHSAAFDIRFLRTICPDWSFGINDTDIRAMARIIGMEVDHGDRLGVSLIDLYDKHCGTIDTTKQRSMKLKRGSLGTLAPSAVSQYAILDAMMTLELYQVFVDNTEEESLPLLQTERVFTALLLQMERVGIPVKLDEIASIKINMLTRISAIEIDLEKRGLSRVGSVMEEAKFLYDKDRLGLLPRVVTLKGHRSVGKEALEPYRGKVAEVDLIIEHRQLVKAISSWLDPIAQDTGPDGRICGEWDVAGTTSARISCSNPNLQALPVTDRDTLTYGSIGAIFGALGSTLLSFDYKQADLRLATLIASENNMAEVLGNGEDPYYSMAEMMGWKKTAENRQKAKQFSLATINAIGVSTASHNFRITKEEAQAALAAHRRAFPRFVHAGKFLERRIATTGYVTLWTGRHVRMAKDEERHKAFSRVVQGGVAEMVKHAMLEVDGLLTGRKSRIIAQIHDSIVVELFPEDEHLVEDILFAMEHLLPEGLMDRVTPPVPMLVEVGSWTEK